MDLQEQQDWNPIVITRAANGFIVTMPRISKNDYMQQIVDNFKNIKSEIQEDPGDLSAIMKQAGVTIPEQPKVPEHQRFVVFKTFQEVLTFLSELADKEKL